MVKVRLKKLYKNQAPCRDKYIQEALDSQTPLQFISLSDGLTMTIKPEDIKARIIGRGETPVKDYWGDTKRFASHNGKPHYLYYFLWHPDPPKQADFLAKVAQC